MAKGQTFSITLPLPVVSKLDAVAKLMGTSRSGSARLIIMSYFDSLPRDKESEIDASIAYSLQTKETE